MRGGKILYEFNGFLDRQVFDVELLVEDALDEYMQGVLTGFFLVSSLI